MGSGVGPVGFEGLPLGSEGVLWGLSGSCGV